MGIGEVLIGLISLAIPALVVVALLVSLVRLLNAVEDTAQTLRRIEVLLRDQPNRVPSGDPDR